MPSGSLSQGGGSTQTNSATNQLIAKSKVNPVSGGIPISTILPQRNTNSELNSYQSEKKLRGFNNGNQFSGQNQMQMKI